MTRVDSGTMGWTSMTTDVGMDERGDVIVLRGASTVANAKLSLARMVMLK